MRFVLIVLAIHFVLELVGRRKNKKEEEEEFVGNRTIHPAEFNLR